MEDRQQTTSSALLEGYESALKTVQRVNSKSLCQREDNGGASQAGSASDSRVKRASFSKQALMSPEDIFKDNQQPMKVFAFIFQVFSAMIGSTLNLALPVLIFLNGFINRYIAQVIEELLKSSPAVAELKWENFQSFPQILVKSFNTHSLLLTIPLALLFFAWAVTSLLVLIIQVMLHEVPMCFVKCIP